MHFSSIRWGFMVAIASAACPKKLIIDTDFGSFDDDPLAIGLGNIFQLWGEVEILGIMSSLSDQYAPPAINAINTFYGHPDIPIAIQKPVTNLTKDPGHPEFGDYVTGLALDWPEDIHNGANTTVPTSLYRKLLSDAEDKSITILCIGEMDNLYHLITSEPDSISQLSGYQLLSQKVTELVAQANAYGQSFNLINHNYTFAETVINNWPPTTKLTFVDDDVAGDIFIGKRLTTELNLGPGPPGNPVAYAFNTSVGYNMTWQVWDATAMYYAVRGLDDVYSYNFTSGRVLALANTNTTWNFNETFYSATGVDEQNDLVFNEGGIGNASFAERLESILLWQPGEHIPSELRRGCGNATGTVGNNGTTGTGAASASSTAVFEGVGARSNSGQAISTVIAATLTLVASLSL